MLFCNRKEQTSKQEMPKLNHIALIHQIMEEGDPEGAIRVIIQNTKDRRAKNISDCFSNIRHKIMLKEKYILPGALDELRALTQDSKFPAEDRQRLSVLIQGPIHKIHWFQTSKSPFYDQAFVEKFKSIRLVRDPFYDFKCPPEITSALTADCRLRMEERHQHQHPKKKAEDYEFTEEQIDAMVETARDYIFANVDWKKKSNSLRLVECLCLLTGRRKTEIINTLQVRTAPGFDGFDYQAEVRGLAKSKKAVLCEDAWTVIPLLAPLAEIVQGITQVRQCHHTGIAYKVHRSLFPDNMTHTVFRDLYSSTAFRFRKTNQFYPDSCSLMFWKSKALCVTFNDIPHYSTLTINRESDIDAKQPEEQP